MAYISAPTVPNAALAQPNIDEVPEEQTVAGRINKLVAEDSPIIQMGRTRADQGMARRGLINSSMALQASDAAAYQAATPIATSDASLLANQRIANQSAKNQVEMQNAQQKNTLSTAGLQSQTQTGIANLQSQTQTGVANIEASYKSLITANESAGKLYQQTVDAINKILIDPNLSAATKQSAIDKQTQLLKGGLNVMGKIAQIDLTSLLDFTGSR